ncbi:hypothetical protein OCV73_09100 [Barnesiella propionica]|uniref:hypothetical protein n=1 Tax=Barnesiella propionica TaxID=2981781 RepID=UPI00142F4591|nr:hypothetical protein [Barnesiella propionica]MCU6769099.1 hypothetical protein [Barnesiella propionica]
MQPLAASVAYPFPHVHRMSAPDYFNAGCEVRIEANLMKPRVTYKFCIIFSFHSK